MLKNLFHKTKLRMARKAGGHTVCDSNRHCVSITQPKHWWNWGRNCLREATWVFMMHTSSTAQAQPRLLRCQAAVPCWGACAGHSQNSRAGAAEASTANPCKPSVPAPSHTGSPVKPAPPAFPWAPHWNHMELLLLSALVCMYTRQSHTAGSTITAIIRSKLEKLLQSCNKWKEIVEVILSTIIYVQLVC